ncbi:hypothetical protein [Bosea sp. ANAM02]|jgi:hypothetical protein|uniref:hypothetical protein n=1 Tax=Bosea sp. ANAM02 TaxID=2020412 RepID=UPI00140ED187|nr:hypothetical protein [Bosea sp. ANAM02]BCB21900.1 hypothetical protein OCUBac02_47940 [Bosea sp. ANAM02]
MKKLSLTIATFAALAMLTMAGPSQSAPSPDLPVASAAAARTVEQASQWLDHLGQRGAEKTSSETRIQLAQTYDHTWTPGNGYAPYNPGVIINDGRSKGWWQYQYYAIQTGGTNGFIIVYYNLVCVGPGRCGATSAASSCWITGYGNGPCAEGPNASIPRNL